VPGKIRKRRTESKKERGGNDESRLKDSGTQRKQVRKGNSDATGKAGGLLGPATEGLKIPDFLIQLAEEEARRRKLVCCDSRKRVSPMSPGEEGGRSNRSKVGVHAWKKKKAKRRGLQSAEQGKIQADETKRRSKKTKRRRKGKRALMDLRKRRRKDGRLARTRPLVEGEKRAASRGENLVPGRIFMHEKREKLTQADIVNDERGEDERSA